MSLRNAVRVGVVVVAGVGAGVVAAADPDVPALPAVPMLPAAVVPEAIPPADSLDVPEISPAIEVPHALPAPVPVVAPAPATAPATASVSRVVPSNTSALASAESLPRMLAEAKTAYAKVRDYAGHYVRQERVSGRLVPEETCELRVRTQPFSVALKVVAPKEYAGRDTVYLSKRATTKVRFKDANKLGYLTLAVDDPRVIADSRHLVSDVGLLAALERVENAVLMEKKLQNPVQVLAAEFTFADKPCTRYEVFADRPHAHRYAHRHVIYVDKKTKLPVRYEAYDQPVAGGPAGGELIESQSFVGLKFNVGLGESNFER
ncbi:MAG: DUF1571 domain-containing protein [Fimbriiglobus sp.]